MIKNVKFDFDFLIFWKTLNEIPELKRRFFLVF